MIMKIAFVAAQDPSHQVQFFSGIPYHLYGALARQVETVPLGIMAKTPPNWWQFYTRLWGKVTGKQARWGLRPAVLKELAGKTAARALAHDVDVVLTVGQGYLVFWNSLLPVSSFSDVLYGSLSKGGFQDQNEKPRKLNRRQQQQMADYAQQAVDHALRIFVTSKFALEGAREYGTNIPPEKVAVTQIGANFQERPGPTTDRRPPPPLKLLWVGTTWEGKGGPEAVAVLDSLLEMGLEVELNLAGRIPENLGHPQVVCHGFLHKDVPEERERLFQLYRQSHLLILPTRKDFTPSGLAEAAALGVPAITTPVGGIPGMFAGDEVVLLPFARYREEAPAVIKNLLESGRLAVMAQKTRQRFETVLNWDVIAEKMVAELAVALKSI
jgi:glycosyltransferase involved in cell wall biosynthesis